MVNNNPLSKKHRPLGVWILTIYALLFAVSNLQGDYFYVLKGEVAMFRSDSVSGMLLWAYLNIGLIIASILTWAGWELGRIFFLLLISIYYLSQGRGMFLWITHQDFGKDLIEYQVDSWIHFIGYILLPILYIWYLNKFSTREFYKKVGKVT